MGTSISRQAVLTSELSYRLPLNARATTALALLQAIYQPFYHPAANKKSPLYP